MPLTHDELTKIADYLSAYRLTNAEFFENPDTAKELDHLIARVYDARMETNVE